MKFRSRRFAETILFGAVSFCLFACQSAADEASVSPKENSANKQSAAIRISGLNANAAEPTIAADGKGGVYVVYVEHNADKSADVYLQKYETGKTLSGEKTRVNPEKGQAKAWFGDAPTVQTGGDGAIYVGWTAKAKSAEKPGASVLYLSVSRDDGKSFAAPVQVNDAAAPAAHGMHSLAIGDDNRVYLAWLDERNLKTDERTNFENDENPSVREPEFVFIKAHHNSNQNKTAKSAKPAIDQPASRNEAAEPNSETFFAVSPDGGRTFAPNVKLSSEVCPCCKTALLVAPDGKVYVSWRQVLPGDYRHIAVASSTDGGENFSAPVIVSDDRWQISACPVSGAPLMFVENSLRTAWFTAGAAGKQGIYLAESKDAGKTFAPRTLLSENAASGTPVLLADAQTARMIWTEAGVVWTTRLRNGEPNDGDRREVGAGEYPAAILSGGKLFVAGVRKDKDKQSVWLTAVE